MILTYLRLLRSKQWIKNLLVFAPLVFSLNLSQSELTLKAVLAFVTYSLLASAVYIVNDLIDMEKDRLHPKKKKRPLAAGLIGVPVAISIAILCFGISIGLALAYLPMQYTLALVMYVGLNTAYSIALKHISIIDCFCIALGFILRIFAGCWAIGVEASDFILTVTFFLALFLGFIKRKSELSILNTTAGQHRKSLEGYSGALLDRFIFICATITLIGYLFYTIDKNTIAIFGNHYLKYSLLFVVYGLFRFIQLSEGKEHEGEGDPTALIYADRPLQWTILLWMTYVASVIYVF